MDEFCNPKNVEDTCWDVENLGLKKIKIHVYTTYVVLNSIHTFLLFPTHSHRNE